MAQIGSNDTTAPDVLVEIVRGEFVESCHRGHVVAVDGGGELVARVGSPDVFTLLRSASKPQQAIPLVASGAADFFGFTDREIALASGSHNGEPVHTEAVVSMLRKAGLGVGTLKCGPHEPYGPQAAEALRKAGLAPTPLHNNCSGKHAGMLALAVYWGAPVDSYDQPDHPVQQAVRRAVAEFAGVAVEEARLATDGCGVPTFGLPLRAAALMAARLVAPPGSFDAETRQACDIIVSAMTYYPEMVEGEGELDTEVIRATGGRVISKVGAEGVYTAGALPCRRWPRGLGVAFKIEDGDAKDRARSPNAIECLRQLGLLDEPEMGLLSPFMNPPVHNRRGEEVGVIRTAFDLK